MKYKVWGTILCVCAILLALVAPALEKPEEKPTRVHQHLEAAEKTPDSVTDKGFSTHLPLVMIDTEGEEIPGKKIQGKDGKPYVTKTADGRASIRATLSVVDHESTYNHAKDQPTMQSDMVIHVRGRSSRAFAKSNYNIRLVTENGENNPQEMLGMDAHHEWVLHGPYLDRSLMRNYMWYNLGGEIMGYAPNVRFCEVLLNGKYEGIYVMTETLTAGEDGSRLSLTVNAKRNTFSGYLLQFNSGYPTTRAITNNFTAYTGLFRGPLEIMYPGRRHLTSEMVTEISKDFSDFEKALFSYDFDSEKYGYKAYIDVQSFVDYLLISELTCNIDASQYSVYIGKETDEKYRMYLWDMNSCCDNYQEAYMDRWSFFMNDSLWYQMLCKDEAFTEAVIDRYWQLRETIFNPDHLCQYIDDTAQFLGPAIERNNTRWEKSYQTKGNAAILEPYTRNPQNYQEACNQMKQFLRERIAWMDDNIESLRQYSAESRVKRYSEVAY